MRSRPVISVIIPVYNTAEYLAECLDSVLAQTFQDVEIICINDGSTDDSPQILEAYAQKDSRIRIINQPNLGVVAARNNAIAQALGTYIFPLDSDDVIVPVCLEKLYSVISSRNYRVVACEAKMFGKKTGYFAQPKFTKYEMYGVHECCVISALFYKEDFEKFGGYKLDFNGYGGDDMDYWLNYIDNDYPMFRLPEMLFFYRIKEKEESVWKNYSRSEMQRRTKEKNAMLLNYHPKMRLWSFLYQIVHSKFVSFFYCYKINNGCRRIKILGLTVYKQKAISSTTRHKIIRILGIKIKIKREV